MQTYARKPQVVPKDVMLDHGYLLHNLSCLTLSIWRYLERYGYNAIYNAIYNAKYNAMYIYNDMYTYLYVYI